MGENMAKQEKAKRTCMRAVEEENKHTIADNGSYPPGFHCPNPRGWYHSVAGVVDTEEGLVAVYRLSDSHSAVYTHIMAAYSKDGGKTWAGHHSISHRNVWEHRSVWVAPQVSKLRDGRLVIICDLGQRTSHDNWPMLTDWQKRPPRGMANYLLWSGDHGKSWSEPVQIDDVGGEPGYIVELSDGTLVYTRTEPFLSEKIMDGPMPWGNIYYRNVAVFSNDGGKTWNRTSIVTDAPYHGDCEVGIVELTPGHLIAATRVGFGNGQFGQPSRFVHSYDYGKTWGKPVLMPFYGQRPILRKLQSGNMLVTYRNRWGTYASYAFAFDPDEKPGFAPASFLWEEWRCSLEDGIMTLKTDRGLEKECWFSLYPAMDGSASVALEAELRIEAAEEGSGAVLCPGCMIHIGKDRVRLAGREKTAGADGETGFPVDNTKWRKYKVIRKDNEISIFVDGELKLKASTKGIEIRPVRFGSVGVAVNHWRSASAKVTNPDDYSIDWAWNADEGYPDQFLRDRMVRLDHSVDSGYSGWTQLKDGTVVIADYTNNSFTGAGGLAPQPILRAYVVKEADLLP